MPVQGVRGAVTIALDDPQDILAATRELLQAMLAANPTLSTADLASAFFTVTPDLSSVHPARAARELGWTAVPMLCATEIGVPGSLPRCVRVLLHWNTEISQGEVRHVYLGEAQSLRPDLQTSLSTVVHQAPESRSETRRQQE